MQGSNLVSPALAGGFFTTSAQVGNKYTFNWVDAVTLFPRLCWHFALLPEVHYNCLTSLPALDTKLVLKFVFWFYFMSISSCFSRETQEDNHWDIPDRPVIAISLSRARGVISISGLGARIPPASQPEDWNIKQKQHCNKFNKNFKNCPHQKNLRKECNHLIHNSHILYHFIDMI